MTQWSAPLDVGESRQWNPATYDTPIVSHRSCPLNGECHPWQVVGYHRGFWFHTVGQRKGVPLSGGPWYCVRKDTRMNAIYISRNYFDSDKPRDTFR